MNRTLVLLNVKVKVNNNYAIVDVKMHVVNKYYVYLSAFLLMN